jgi:hypothetical protein
MKDLIGHVFGGVEAIAILIVAATLSPRILPTPDRLELPPPAPEAQAAPHEVVPAPAPNAEESAEEHEPPRPRVAIGFNPPVEQSSPESPPLLEVPPLPVAPQPPIAVVAERNEEACQPVVDPPGEPRLSPEVIALHWLWDIERFRFMVQSGYIDGGLRRAFGDRYADVRRIAFSNARLNQLPEAPDAYIRSLTRDAEVGQLPPLPDHNLTIFRGPAPRFKPRPIRNSSPTVRKTSPPPQPQGTRRQLR